MLGSHFAVLQNSFRIIHNGNRLKMSERRKAEVTRRIIALVASILGVPGVFFLLWTYVFPNRGNSALNSGFLIWACIVFIFERRLSNFLKSN